MSVPTMNTPLAAVFAFAGLTMLSIRSISGDSVAEAFYQAFGIFSFGLSGVALLIGFVPVTRDQERQDSHDFKRCVECQEYIMRKATRCPFCRTDLIAAEEAEARGHATDT